MKAGTAAAFLVALGLGLALGAPQAVAGSAAPSAVAASVPAGDVPELAALLDQRQRFIAAARAHRWQQVQAAVMDYGLGAEWQSRLRQGYVDHVLDQQAAGLELVSERLVGERLLRRGDEVLAVLDVRATWLHPLHPGGRMTTGSRVFAVSSDGGRRWAFNVLDCFEDLHLERTWPGAAAALRPVAADPGA